MNDMKDFEMQVAWLINRVRELESENYQLRLSFALQDHKRSRGRPRKAPKPPTLPKRRGRKPQKLLPSALEFIKSLKQEHNVKTDKDALQKLAESLAVKLGLGMHRANDSDVKTLLKTFRNQISKLRKSQKFPREIS